MPNDPQIETPVSSGATDFPNAPQSSDADLARNIASAQAAGYKVQQAPPDYAALAQKYGVGISAVTAVQNSPAAPAASKASPAPTAQGTQPNQSGTQSGTPDYAALAAKHGVAISAPQAQTQDQGVANAQNPSVQKSMIDRAADVASGFYDQTVGAGVNLAKQLYADTKAYYAAHPDKILPTVLEPGTAAGDAAEDAIFKHAEKDPEHPLAKVVKGIVQSHIDTGKKAYAAQAQAAEALKNGDYKTAALLYAQAQGYGVATGLPLVGPAAAKIGEDVTENPEYAAGETGGLITSILAPSYLGEKIMPTTVKVAGVDVPVRAAVNEPGFINQTAEALANKRMLQNFDVADTQSAARDSIANAATQTVRNPELEAARTALKQGAIADFNDAVNAVMEPTHPLTEALKESYARGLPGRVSIGGRTMPNIAQIDSAYNAAIAAANGDFGAVAQALNESVSPLFEKASQQSIADGGSSWKEMADARDAAFRRGDVTDLNAIKAKMKAAFEKANATGSFDVANHLYAKLDDINRINDVFKSSAVLKPTPVDFVEQNRTAAGVDAGIIDGKALRTAVRKLNEDGTFKNVGVSQDTVNDLQRLGELLERSKVKPGMASVGWFGRAGRILKGATGADRGLAYLMTHPDELKMAIGLAQGGAMVQANQPTHRYDPDSEQVLPIAP